MRLFRDRDFSRILDMEFLHEYDEAKKLHLVNKAENFTFVNDDVTACFVYEPVIDGVYQCHMMSNKGLRGRELWKFATKSAIRMVEGFGMNELLGFVSNKDQRCKMFLSQVGMEKKMELKTTDVYVADKEHILKLKKRG